MLTRADRPDRSRLCVPPGKSRPPRLAAGRRPRGWCIRLLPPAYARGPSPSYGVVGDDSRPLHRTAAGPLAQVRRFPRRGRGRVVHGARRRVERPGLPAGGLAHLAAARGLAPRPGVAAAVAGGGHGGDRGGVRGLGAVRAHRGAAEPPGDRRAVHGRRTRGPATHAVDRADRLLHVGRGRPVGGQRRGEPAGARGAGDAVAARPVAAGRSRANAAAVAGRVRRSGRPRGGGPGAGGGPAGARGTGADRP